MELRQPLSQYGVKTRVCPDSVFYTNLYVNYPLRLGVVGQARNTEIWCRMETIHNDILQRMNTTNNELWCRMETTNNEIWCRMETTNNEIWCRMETHRQYFADNEGHIQCDLVLNQNP